MSEKPVSSPFDFPSFMIPPFSNWAYAEREDKMEERAVAGMQLVHRTVWDQAEKALDKHMAFMSHRMHEDFECAKALGECRMPEQAFSTLQQFYTKMADEYQTHIKDQIENFQKGLSENLATAEELSETAVQTATELAQAAEDSLEEQASAKPKRRARRTAPAK